MFLGKILIPNIIKTRSPKGKMVKQIVLVRQKLKILSLWRNSNSYFDLKGGKKNSRYDIFFSLFLFATLRLSCVNKSPYVLMEKLMFFFISNCIICHKIKLAWGNAKTKYLKRTSELEHVLSQKSCSFVIP